MQLSVQKQGYTIIQAILVDNDVYLPVIDIFNYLKIKIDVKVGMKYISGFFINEENTYFIDIDNGIIQNGSNSISTVRKDFILTETNLFMRRDLFQKAFGLKCTFNFRALEVNLDTDLQLPVIREMMRERERQNLQRINDLNFVADRVLSREHSWMQGAALDWSLQNIYTSKSNTQMYSLASGIEVFGGDMDAFLNGTINKKIDWNEVEWRWRYVDEGSAWFRQAIVGHVDAISLATHYGSVVGVQISNSPPTYRRAFGTYLIHDFTQPDWIVELYVNQQLVDFVKADAAGMYQFAIPLAYGPTYVTLKFYGPWGEERSLEKLISIPYTFIPAGEVEYTASAGRVITEKNKEVAQVDLRAGLTSHFTVGGGVQYFNSSDTTKPITPFASMAYRVFDEVLLTADYADRNYIKGLISYTHPSQFGIELGYARFSQNATTNYSELIEERKASFSIPMRTSFTSGIARLNVQQNIFAHSKSISSEASISTSLLGIQTNLSGTGQWVNDGSNIYSFLRSALSLSFRTIGNITIRPQTEFDISNNKFTYLRSYFETQIFDLGWLSLNYEYNFPTKSSFALLEFRYDLPFTQLNSNLRYSKEQSAYAQSARGTIGLDSHAPKIIADNRNWVRRGALTIRPFLDLNNNDIMDPDEEPVQNLDVSINGGRILPSNDKSIIRIVDLQPYTQYILTITALNFENLSWQPKYKSYSITVDPNQFKEIQIPILITGEVNGKVQRRTIAGDKGQGGVRIFFRQTDGIFFDKTLTLSEGEFYLSGLLPGNYTAHIDTTQLERLALISDPPSIDFKIRSVMEGDVVDNINFLLRPAMPAIAAHSIDTTTSQKTDTTIAALQPKRDTTATVVTIKRPPIEAPIEIGKVKNLPINLVRRSLDSSIISYLDRIIATWKADPSLIAVVEGHSDNFGTSQQHQDRSMQRATRVRDYLIQNGIKSSNIQTRGFGSRRPIATNMTAAGRAKNNRVDVTLIKEN